MRNFDCPQATAPLEDWLHYIDHIHIHNIELNLERVLYVAKRLNLLKPAPFIFTVTGTNGKGTTCRTLEILLIAAGYRVGVYSSPHLVSYTERVRIQGIELGAALHSASFAEIEARREDISLTYFEFGTLSALNLFYKANLEIVILEVGLGGRLDATNIVNPDVSIITSIALDHIDLLGPDRGSIAKEKAGIFRKGKPAIVGESEILNIIDDIATKEGACLHQCNRHWEWQKNNNSWMLQDKYGKLCNLPLTQIPISNAATALVALRASQLQIHEDIIRYYLPRITLVGRFHTVSMSPHVILDVAHNSHAAYYLSSRLANVTKKGKIHAVVGIFCDKDIYSMLAALESQVSYWYCASLYGRRGTSAEKLMIYLSQRKCYYKGFTDVNKAWLAACQHACSEDIIIVYGSFQTVAQVMKSMTMEKVCVIK